MAYIYIPYDDGSPTVSGTIRLTRKEYEELKFLAGNSKASKGTVIGWVIDQLYKIAIEEKKRRDNETRDSN